MKTKSIFVATVVLASNLFPTIASAGSGNFGQDLRVVKQRIDNVLARIPAGGRVSGIVPGGQANPLLPLAFANDDELNENDLLAVPILAQAGATISQATDHADQYHHLASIGQSQLAMVEFGRACLRMGLSRSQISRANLAAAQPPLGYLSAFGQEMTDSLEELQSIKAFYGCP